jgi:small-conductance mechanosensitive channel
MGTVKKIGLKTTRIKALGGEEIVISNQELTTTRVQNYKKLFERRVLFQIGVTYDTPRAKIEAVPAAIQKMIEQEEQARFDRAHFFRFGESSLDFEVVFYVLDPAYGTYMDIQQRINLNIMHYFEKQKIEFAFPTRTVQVVKE